MYSWHRRSSSPVVTPVLTCGVMKSSTSAASRPASRMPSISSAVLMTTAMDHKAFRKRRRIEDGERGGNFPAGGEALNRLFGKANCWGLQGVRAILRGHLGAMNSAFGGGAGSAQISASAL